MKKILTAIPIAAALICVASCSSDAPAPPSGADSGATPASWCRSESDAVAIAADAISMLDDQTDSRSAVRRVDSSNVRLMRSIAQGRSATDSLYYVVNFADSAGFAVVAAPRSCEPLLAVTESGSYDPDLGTDNPGLRLFMDAAAAYAATHPPMLPIDSLRPVFPGGGELMYKIIRDTISKKVIAPKLDLKWGQGGEWGKYFSNNLAGCVNIAHVMCMAYVEKPTSIGCSFRDHKYDFFDLKWDYFKKIKDNSMWNLIPQEQSDKLSHFIREIGERNNTKQVNGASSSNIENAHITSRVLGLNIGAIKCYDYTFKEILNESNIILMVGDKKKQPDNNGDIFGHAWVVDGIKYFVIHSKEAINKNPLTDWEIINDLGIQIYDFNHINWGWKGVNNGYFLSSVFEPSRGSMYDNEKGSSENYQYNLKYFIISK